MGLKPRMSFAPIHTGPTIDGLDIREFRLLVPPDAGPGITVRWVWTADGQEHGVPEDMTLAAEEMGDVTALESALVAWLTARLTERRRMPGDAKPAAPKPAPAPAPAGPGLGTLR